MRTARSQPSRAKQRFWTNAGASAPVALAVPVGELRLEEQLLARHDACAVRGGEALADAGLEVVAPLVRGVDAAKARSQRELGHRGGAVFLPGRAVEEIGNGGGRHYRTDAFGATETPRASVFSIARATSPEALASSTKPRRYARPASRPLGTPTACGTFMNCPSSMRDPGSLSASPISACLNPASASTVPLASRSKAASAFGARTSCARFRLRLRNSS